MNVETGRIVDLVDTEEMKNALDNGIIQAIQDSDMTEKQKKTK